LEEADLVFWGELAETLSANELKEAMALEQSQLGFQEWYVFDFSLGDGTILERRESRPAYNFGWMWGSWGWSGRGEIDPLARDRRG